MHNISMYEKHPSTPLARPYFTHPLTAVAQSHEVHLHYPHYGHSQSAEPEP